MPSEIGYFALLLALFVALRQAAVPRVRARRDDPAIALFADRAAIVQLAHVARAFACLIRAFVASHLAVEVVTSNSQTRKGAFRSQPPRRSGNALLDQWSPS